MASINDIVNLDNYKGNPVAGGATATALDVNTRPLDMLGAYTNMYNKSLYDQTIKDRDTKLNNLAEMSKIDANNLFGKDKDYLVGKLNDLSQIATEYAKNPNLTLQDQLKWQTALSSVNNDYLSGKQRALTYHSQVDDINQKYSGEEKDIRLKELNDKFNNTDISTPISVGTGYKPVSVELPPAMTEDIQTLKNMKNEVVTVNSKVYIPQKNSALASATVLGINSLGDDLKGTEKDLQNTAYGAAQHWASMTSVINSAIGAKNQDGSYKYFDQNGNFLSDKFEQENASNGVVMPVYNAIKDLTAYSTQKTNELKYGVYSDNGLQYKAPETLTPQDFQSGIIKITPNGLTPEQLVQSGMYAQYKGDVVTKKFQKTGLGIEQQTADSGTMNAVSTRMNAITNEKKLGFSREKWKASSGGTDAQQNYALQRAQTIYNDLKKLTNSKGVITPDKVRQLNSEQLKYLGSLQQNVTMNDGKKFEFQPLDVTHDANGNPVQTAIQLENGTISVLVPKPGQTSVGVTKTGDFTGQWDNSKAITVRGIADNVLHEQLKNGVKGEKEYNQVNQEGVDGDGTDAEDSTDADNSGGGNAAPAKAAPMVKAKNQSYYSNKSNLQSFDGSKATFKDGSVWVVDTKSGRLKQIK